MVAKTKVAQEFEKAIGVDWKGLFDSVNAIQDGEELERILFYVFGWCEGRNDMIFYRGIESALHNKTKRRARCLKQKLR